MPQDGDRPPSPRLEPVVFPPTGEFPQVDDIFPPAAGAPRKATDPTRGRRSDPTHPPSSDRPPPPPRNPESPAPATRDHPPFPESPALPTGYPPTSPAYQTLTPNYPPPPGDPGFPDFPAHPPHGPGHARPQPSPRPGRGGPDPTILVVISVIVVVALIAGILLTIGILHRPAPTAQASRTGHKTPHVIDTGGLATLAKLAVPATIKVKDGVKPNLPWPSSGESIVAVSRLGTMGKSGGNAPRPIASITKVMTAYIVLNDHPLKPGQAGPTITVTPAEAAAYPQQQAGHESLVKVSAGEQITEYQALQALLIASGDNMAQILARWDAGSIPAFVAKMNKMAKSLEMKSTRFVDPDGLSSGSVSNSEDLLELASVALGEPAMVEIMRTKTATIPLNTITNYNTLLGQDGVFGIKTGSTTPAGGCLLFAAERVVAGKTYSIFGAVLGAPGNRTTMLKNAMTDSKALIDAATSALQPVTLIKAGTTVATVRNAAGVTSRYEVGKDVGVNGWKGLPWHLRLSTSLKPGQGPGQVIIRASTGQLTIPLSKVAAKK